MTAQPIFVIGSSNVDLIMKMPRLPKVGETITDADFLQTFGGKGANSAVACARAGGNTVFINAVGEDAYAPALLTSLREAGVDTQFVQHETGCASGHALVMIGEAGSNYLSVAPGANYRLTPQVIEQLASEIARAGRILIQNEIPAATNRAILALARTHGIPVAWNFAPSITATLEDFADVDTLVVNETEAEDIASQLGQSASASEPDALLKALRNLGPKQIIITLGGDGVLAAQGTETFRLPAFKVDVVDTTAAGDTFCGTLAVAMVEGKALPDALRFASAAAAIAVTRLGAQPSCPTRAEIDQLISA